MTKYMHKCQYHPSILALT